ncbi:MAG: hypothetical protein J5586_06620 [Clostridia bacterium]|nr:hypothetical protein [Clostridia bacterium]
MAVAEGNFDHPVNGQKVMSRAARREQSERQPAPRPEVRIFSPRPKKPLSFDKGFFNEVTLWG